MDTYGRDGSVAPARPDTGWRPPPNQTARVVAVTLVTALAVATLAVIDLTAAAPPAGATVPPGFRLSTVISGLTEPIGVQFAADGRVFVAEKSGIIKVFDGLTDATPTVFADLRTEVVEGVIAESEDETLLDSYLAREVVEVSVLTADLETAVARGHFHPVLAAAPLAGVGTRELLDLLVAGFPSPLEHPCPPVTRPDGSPACPITCDPEGPLVAEVALALEVDQDRATEILELVATGTPLTEFGFSEENDDAALV